MAGKVQKLEFAGASGAKLAARLDLPPGDIRAYALFAHCFTCSKDVFAASRIAGELAARGFAVLRFDFTGLGASEGEFASTNFSSNVDDLVSAADYLRDHFAAPQIIIGHSLGGAAALVAADRIAELRAVVTIGAPADAAHVVDNFAADLEQIETTGKATVSLAGRDFTIQKQFLDDVRDHALESHIANLRRPLLVMHAPLDETVGIENASRIFVAAKHPKSFISLDTADHLLSRREDAVYAADIIAAWASRFLDKKPDTASPGHEDVYVTETGQGKFQQIVTLGRHRLIADEPKEVGGLDSGPSPYDYLSAALGACTTMTLRMYADRKKIPLERVGVRVSHGKIHLEDCEGCEKGESHKIDQFQRILDFSGDLTDEQRARLLEIADRCPVHRTLETKSEILTRLNDASDQ
ncbi:MAG: bifunctional alpha/beta hydrolase/OsmC family protein [Fimbriimonadaceae bacterium]|nr:bifunctional alpha/beta hydrolase/OsmC family protein [Alphaproteobacteria bacterium]